MLCIRCFFFFFQQNAAYDMRISDWSSDVCSSDLYPHFDRYDLSALQMKFCTSAPFPAELKAEVLNRFAGGLIESYGMTEGGLSCILVAHEHPEKLHTFGRPAPGNPLKVLGERAEARRVGKGCDVTCRSRGLTDY